MTQANSPPTTQLYDLVAMADHKTPWLIDGILIENELAVIHGAEHTGKSFIVLDLALRVALRLDWHGRAVKQMPVMYLPSEGLSGVNRRLASWMRWHMSADTLKDSTLWPSDPGIDEEGNVLTMADVLKSVPFHRYDGLNPDTEALEYGSNETPAEAKAAQRAEAQQAQEAEAVKRKIQAANKVAREVADMKANRPQGQPSRDVAAEIAERHHAARNHAKDDD